jgi:hypothetical protein
MLISPDGKFEEKSIRFKVQPFFYQTLLFRVSLSIVI